MSPRIRDFVCYFAFVLLSILFFWKDRYLEAIWLLLVLVCYMLRAILLVLQRRLPVPPIKDSPWSDT